MATFNGTLKYKQDDGSIVELNPVGVDARARTLATAAGQTANNAQTATENVQRTVNGIATQIQLIEQTTGYNASPEDVPATSMKESIEDLNTEVRHLDTNVNTLNTKVSNLENAGTKTNFIFPAFGTVIESTASSVTVAFPMPEELYYKLNYDSSFSVGLATVSTLTAGGSSTVAYCATRTTEQALVAFVVEGKRLSVNKEMGYLYATFNTGTQNATKCLGMPVVPFRDESFFSVPYIKVVLS